MFQRVFIANRGEIAVRVIRTLREMGITCIVGYSDADRQALFVEMADEAYRLGGDSPSDSYLNVKHILSVARQARAEAVHPGYGFLAENAPFAEAVEKASMTFIGPPVHAIRLMGDKVRARAAVAELGVPVVPGTPGPVGTLEEALDFARAAGYPVAVKAAGGGGGRGIRVVPAPGAMAEALERARREAEAYFKNPDVYLERYFPDPRHVEIQVLGDRRGHLVHLGERDCSVQRRHQKLIEEAPSPAVDADLRARMGEMALLAAQSAGYSSAGTVEFLLTREGAFYFLEMNTRIQVEHPVTEMVSGTDLIREMVLAAADEPISVETSMLQPDGHAMEVRVNAEDPLAGFRPTPAVISRYRQPGGPGVRVDTGAFEGWRIPESYDSLLAKLIVWAPDRETARSRMLRALREFAVAGPSTTIPFSEAVLRHPIFVAGQAGTSFVEEHQEDLQAYMKEAGPSSVPLSIAAPADEYRSFDVEVNRKLYRVRVAESRSREEISSRPRRATAARPRLDGNAVTSPMHGTVIAITRQPGEAVREGETLFIIEAMKMENEVAAHVGGTVASLDVQLGETVESGQRLGTIE